MDYPIMINTPQTMSVDDAPVALPAAIDTSTALANYDAACRALAAAVAVDEVQDIRAKAEALRAYAKQAKNRQMEMDAAEIRIRAERRLGELMAAQGETVGTAKGQLRRGLESNPREPTDPPTLAEAGIDKGLAHRARTYAAVPKDQFEQLLSDKRRRDNRRVVLDPEFQTEADAAARDIEIERDERIALSGGGELAAENEQLQRQVALLDRRIAALQEENSSLKFRENMWRERAVTAGWKKGQANA
jgi:FtsZ-binding cell division protein ZapB